VSEKYRPPVRDQEEEEWDILDEINGVSVNKEKQKSTRPDWLPDNITPVLEEPPKWEYLAETLLEIEELLMNHPAPEGK
jgi:DNA excision repair protein ERCC-4